MTAGPVPGSPRHVTFVTGKLAEPSLRRVLDAMVPAFAYEVVVMKITVAALMPAAWIARWLRVPPGTELVVIPGLCEGDLDPIAAAAGAPVVRGPKDLRDIPAFFGRPAAPADYGTFDIEILAEINQAPRLGLSTILREARALRADGADIIDIGCVPGVPFPALHETVAALVADGLRVSVDTFDPGEIRTAVAAGAELVLSVNGTNVDVAGDLAGTGATAVVVPDLGGPVDTMAPTIAALDRAGVPYLLDPILSPIGHGFLASLVAYADVRRRYPDAGMLMGVGNLTEMTAADSTGVNALLVAACQELGVRAVLTTQVAPWARGAVREVDIARRLMRHAIEHQTTPKAADTRLLTTRDPRAARHPEAELRELQAGLSDPNFRIFADDEAITVLNRDLFVRGTDVDDVFARLGVSDASHAFYLGQELARASLARHLGKVYRQDSPLQWGYLTDGNPAPARHLRPASRRPRS